MAHQGAVATSQPLATLAGLDVLRGGGSAVDAAIAANAMLGLVEPTGCGIGGDLFAIVWDAGAERLHGLNASGRSPRTLTLAQLTAFGLASIPSEGPLAVSVPGAVDGWHELNARFGRRPLAALLAPAIEYAERGFPLTEVIAAAWAEDAERLGAFPGYAEVFLPGGRAPRAGERFKNPRLARTYKLLAAAGREAFYRGPIARSIEEYMRSHGGFLSAADLAEHRSEWVEPVSTRYRGYDVWELPPNGQGIVVLEMLNILEGYDLRSLGWGSVRHVHLLVEAKKLAFEDRARFYADPEFGPLPSARLRSKEYGAARRAEIRDDRAARIPAPGDADAPVAADTVYLAAADSAGNMVSLIQSNFRGMGSGMTPGDLGFVLHNRGEAFSLDPGHPNAYAPGKRPFHTIIPGFLSKDGEALMSFGVMGADMQPQGHVQVLTNMIDFGMNIQQAGDAPRVRHDGSSDPCGGKASDGGTVYLESGFSPDVAGGLEALGHRVQRGGAGFGGYQAVMRDLKLDVYMAASESRKDGFAAGY
jgi:gamma-glutamyltranspeptidase / glutathione hydrolase